MLPESLKKYRYVWPSEPLDKDYKWQACENSAFWVRHLPETRENLAKDSRWPALFPSPIGIVTTGDGQNAAMERVVAPCLVNRFPFILALTFCNEEISSRHHPRRRFMEMLLENGSATIQFLPPGPQLDAAMAAISDFGDEMAHKRLEASGLAFHPGVNSQAPVLDDSYMAYEANLVPPGKDFLGKEIFPQPWKDVGSHRVFFLEVRAIQLRKDIAEGKGQVAWRSLPDFEPQLSFAAQDSDDSAMTELAYTKGFTPNYRFPAAGTIGFEYEYVSHGMAVRTMPSEAADQVEIDNDRARWPCFFPASLGMITSWAPDGKADVMPCGSVTMVSRDPLIIGACVCYTDINDRYYARRTLSHIRDTGRMGCGTPVIEESVLKAITYSGNVSMAKDADKVLHSGLQLAGIGKSPVFSQLPVHFDCTLVGEIPMGTHAMMLGEVRRIYLRNDVSSENPLEWCPFAAVVPAEH